MESRILSANEIKKILEKLSSQVIKDMGNDIAVVGIKRRGAILAERIKKLIERKTSKNIDCGSLDITLYRDDFSAIGSHPVVSGSELMFDPDNRKILLVDDVLYTGRTIRAAIDQIIDYGRPKVIRLFVLVDRTNCRELPIQADYLGMKLIVGKNQIVEVKLKEVDKTEEVVITERK
ncbi:MAG TPA: bifunctional pyr operon transcriptional regulator/uracil phosphoribosyltransferase PyrR [bacterium]|nr:bifunctional pyr operon transcriptional regulator/uracil phosphoribosyltransferase PyrR [bacterium]HOL35817.1 bifunctional pyr operon transcriptional regulator/uracil phosphoribosyltransferase PyrR [bacterium]HPO52265.1 bifunctional pyr operon transcriptional regulator/uracil phosphoribosyltransferase PyrR [bacterium]